MLRSCPVPAGKPSHRMGTGEGEVFYSFARPKKHGAWRAMPDLKHLSRVLRRRRRKPSASWWGLARWGGGPKASIDLKDTYGRPLDVPYSNSGASQHGFSRNSSGVFFPSIYGMSQWYLSFSQGFWSVAACGPQPFLAAAVLPHESRTPPQL